MARDITYNVLELKVFILMQACGEWLGEDLSTSYEKLMRTYLKAAQAGVNMDVKLKTKSPSHVAKRSISNVALSNNQRNIMSKDISFRLHNYLNPLRRYKRDTASSIKDKDQDVDPWELERLIGEDFRRKNISLTPDQNDTLNEIRIGLLDDTNSWSKIHFNLEKVPDNFTEFISAKEAEGVDLTLFYEKTKKNQFMWVSKTMELVHTTPERLNLTVNQFCALFSSFCKFNKPIAITCHGIRAAAQASYGIEVDDLKGWSKKDLERCLETLGRMPVSKMKRKAIWKLFKEKQVISYLLCFKPFIN